MKRTIVFINVGIRQNAPVSIPVIPIAMITAAVRLYCLNISSAIPNPNIIPIIPSGYLNIVSVTRRSRLLGVAL